MWSEASGWKFLNGLRSTFEVFCSSLCSRIQLNSIENEWKKWIKAKRFRMFYVKVTIDENRNTNIDEFRSLMNDGGWKRRRLRFFSFNFNPPADFMGIACKKVFYWSMLHLMMSRWSQVAGFSIILFFVHDADAYLMSSDCETVNQQANLIRAIWFYHFKRSEAFFMECFSFSPNLEAPRHHVRLNWISIAMCKCVPTLVQCFESCCNIIAQQVTSEERRFIYSQLWHLENVLK